MGAHAAGVLFSAARRKPLFTNLLAREMGQEMRDEDLGEPPKPARGTRALPFKTPRSELL